MFAGGNQTRLRVEAVGNTTSVPDDPYIRLGYYLGAVASTDLPEEIPDHLKNWKSMQSTAYHSNNDLREILAWADGYSPEKMQTTGFFSRVPDDALGSSANKFLRVTASSTDVGLLAGNSAAVALIRNSTASIDIMVYEQCWVNNNYYGPRQQLLRVIDYRDTEARRQAEARQHLGGETNGAKQSACCNVY
jgi:hypothetical protein